MPSRKVGKEALALAKKRYRPSGTPTSRPIRAGSLLDQIAADPDRFSEISIVLTHTEAKPKQRARARSAMIAANPSKEEAITLMPDNGMFIGWDRRDLARWRRPFIEFWMPDDRLHCYGRMASYYHDATGTVMSRNYWPAVQSVIEGDLPDPKIISKVDQQMVRRLLDKHDDVLFTSRELAAAMDRLA